MRTSIASEYVKETVKKYLHMAQRMKNSRKTKDLRHERDFKIHHYRQQQSMGILYVIISMKYKNMEYRSQYFLNSM